MGWAIRGGGEAKVAVGRSYAHAEHGKVRANNEKGKGDEMKEGERARENGGRA